MGASNLDCDSKAIQVERAESKRTCRQGKPTPNNHNHVKEHTPHPSGELEQSEIILLRQCDGCAASDFGRVPCAARTSYGT